MTRPIATAWGREGANPVDLGYGGLITGTTIATWPARYQRSYAYAGQVCAGMLWPEGGQALGLTYAPLSLRGGPGAGYDADTMLIRARRPHDGLRVITIAALGTYLDLEVRVAPFGGSATTYVMSDTGVDVWQTLDVTIPDDPCIVTYRARRSVNDPDARVFAIAIRERVLEEADL